MKMPVRQQREIDRNRDRYFMLPTSSYTMVYESVIINGRQGKGEGMPRTSRMIVKNETAIYHVMSRTALDGFPLQAFEKDYLVELVQRMGNLFFTDIYGYCMMGNHFHILVKMIPEDHFTDDVVKERLVRFYGEKKAPVGEGQLPVMREKLAGLSEFLREIKVNFTRFYNKRHGRRGYFWGDRFKSLIVEKGQTLINCLAYIDLNPVRAGIVKKPEDYRWSSLGYHIQTGNKDGFLSTDFGLSEFNVNRKKERVRRYRKYVYESGGIEPGDKPFVKTIDEKIVNKERRKDFEISRTDRFIYRTRYFTDSGIIGSREYVSDTYRQFKHLFQSKREKKPKAVKGLDGMFSLKRLSEMI